MCTCIVCTCIVCTCIVCTPIHVQVYYISTRNNGNTIKLYSPTSTLHNDSESAYICLVILKLARYFNNISIKILILLLTWLLLIGVESRWRIGSHIFTDNK